MTREEKLISRIRDYLDSGLWKYEACPLGKEDLEVIIKALEQEPCEDCIGRSAITDTTICEGISCNECSFNTCEDGQSGCLLHERVGKLPSVQPKIENKDCISREQAKAEIRKAFPSLPDRVDINSILNELPCVQLSTDILNKIKAEIETIEISGMVDDDTMYVRSAEQIKNIVIEIIDKYKEG